MICSYLLFQTAIAASVDLRCYGLTTPRQDNRISVHFHDVEHFSYEWEIDSLPWKSVVAAVPGKDYQDLDQGLVDALLQGPLAQISDAQKHARTASLAFLYLYMTLCNGDKQ